MRRWKQWRPLLLAIAIALSIMLANCDTPPETGESPSPTDNPAALATGSLIYGSGGQPVNLESGNVTDGDSIIVQQQIYDRLLAFKPGTTELEPGLATEWDSSEEGKIWTFQLREEVKFHDDTDFNAEAVEFNVRRWWDPDFEEGYREAGKEYVIWGNLFGGFRGDADSLLEEINVEDDYTIEFVLKQPFAAFPAALASGYFGIASPAAIREAGAEYGTPASTAVGTGPFVFQEWRTGDRIILTKNPNYWQEDLPIEEELIFRFITDPAARLAELRAGSIDFTPDLAPDQLDEMEGDASVEAVLRPSFNVGYLALNTNYEPLSNPQVRRAIAMAINREELVDAFWSGLGETSGHFTPPALEWSHSSDVGEYEYDAEAAEQMLTEAGYPDGFDLELWYMPVSRPYYPTPKPIAEAFAADLSAIGINVSLQTKDWAAYLEDRRRSPGFQAFMLGWTGDYGDPDNFYYPHFGPAATDDIGDWENERILELLEEGRETQDMDTRANIYAEIDEILFEEAVRIPIVHSQPLLGKRANIDRWEPSPLGSEPFAIIDKT
jgi:peptide/nickel transport system substrate-binding protein